MFILLYKKCDKMKNKKDLMFGIVFLLIMIASIFSIELMFIPFVRADGCDWTTYGNQFTPLWNEQFSPSICYGVLSNVSVNRTISGGMAMGTQPIVSSLGDIGRNYYILVNGNYLQVYDKDFNIVSEVLSGASLVNVDTLDFLGTGITRDIAYIYSRNATSYGIKVYTFNSSDSSLTLSFVYNFTDSLSNLIGLRHSGGNIYFMNSTSLIKVNNTNITSVSVPSSLNPFTEPLSFYVDYNGDSIRDFMTYDTEKLFIFDENGNKILEINYSNIVGGKRLRSARMIKPTSSNLWKVVTLVNDGISTALPSMSINEYNLDGSLVWSTSVAGGSSSTQFFYGDLAIADDYDGDNFPDIYCVWYLSHPLNTDQKGFKIFKGNTGSLLFSRTNSFSPLGFTFPKLTIADMNHDSKYDFIYNLQGRLEVVSAFTNTSLFNSSSSSGYCIPADLDFDGRLDIVCSNTSSSITFFSNYTNQNPIINNIVYSPDINVLSNTNVYAYINATDFEGDIIYYRHSCFDGDSFTSDSTSSIQQCYYGIQGIYNMTIQTRDSYHSDYNSFSQSITVSDNIINPCNYNGICETGIGENNVNCANDCNSLNQSQNQQANDTGGIPIPTELVSTTNINQGLLPEIYFGTLGFFSNTLQPMIILIFGIFFVLIVLAIAFIIRSVAGKVGELGR